jgi:beta-N-acetylhexosaminidase
VPGADHALIRAYARRVGLPARRLPHYRGTATSWQNATFPRSSAFVVELPAGALSRAAARRHARAVEQTVAPPQARRAQESAPKPPIEWSPIPFGVKRRRQMAAYSERHYGVAEARLLEVRTIVEHVTASSTYESAFNTFASNARDSELGELPGTCAHFIVDTDGTIHQLVRLKWRCRHTVGLNDRSIGIEHVGLSDGQVMGDGRQRRASLRLTRWLQARYGVPTRDVIGHAESLSSPYHHERVKRLRTQTHGDMQPSTMRRYRRLL